MDAKTINENDCRSNPGAVVAVLFTVLRGAVANTLRTYGLTQDADVDDYHADACFHLLTYSIPRYDASKGVDVRKFAIIAAENYCRNVLARHENSRTHVGYETCGNDGDDVTGEAVGTVGHIESTSSDAATRKHVKHDASRESTVHVTGTVSEPNDTASDFAKAADMARMLDGMADALATLTPRQQAFVDAIVASDTQKEAAKRMGFSEPTAHREFKAVVAALRTALGLDDDSDE